MQAKETPPPLREDNMGVIPYVGEPKLALYTIERELSELLDMRALAEEEGAPPAELEAIDKTIAEYFSREIRKVDGICHALNTFAAAEETARKEAKRLNERADNLERQYERIKAATLRAMQDHGVRVLETPTNKLRVQANGGKEPLEVTAAPDQYQDAIVKLPRLLWRAVLREIPGLLLEEVGKNCRETLEPNGDRIRAALKQQVPCPEHDPYREVGLSKPCARCEGRGTIPNTVPGAKLLPRGSHLRIE